ncbi:hypothetical protein BDC45DRAFT_529446 [Circinella umbellata]|nr:hypothetical protein BDC45DRAFT_529446 [Circinella umbellata]
MREINRTNENFIFGYNYNDQDCVIFVFQGFGYIVEMWSVQVRVLKASVWYRLYHTLIVIQSVIFFHSYSNTSFHHVHIYIKIDIHCYPSVTFTYSTLGCLMERIIPQMDIRMQKQNIVFFLTVSITTGILPKT